MPHLPVMTPPYEWRHTVTEDELDQNNHVNNVVYVKWLEHAAILNSSVWGLTPDFYVKINQTWVARRHTVDYLRPAYLGDELIIRTWIADTKRVMSTRGYEVVRVKDGEILATGETLWAFVRMDTGHPTRIAPEVIAAIDNYVKSVPDFVPDAPTTGKQ